MSLPNAPMGLHVCALSAKLVLVTPITWKGCQVPLPPVHAPCRRHRRALRPTPPLPDARSDGARLRGRAARRCAACRERTHRARVCHSHRRAPRDRPPPARRIGVRERGGEHAPGRFFVAGVREHARGGEPHAGSGSLASFCASGAARLPCRCASTIMFAAPARMVHSGAVIARSIAFAPSSGRVFFTAIAAAARPSDRDRRQARPAPRSRFAASSSSIAGEPHAERCDRRALACRASARLPMPIRASAMPAAARTPSSGSRRWRVSSSTASWSLIMPSQRIAARRTPRIGIRAGFLEIRDRELAELLADALDRDAPRFGVLAAQHLVGDLRRLREAPEHGDRRRGGDAIVLVLHALRDLIGEVVELELLRPLRSPRSSASPTASRAPARSSRCARSRSSSLSSLAARVPSTARTPSRRRRHRRARAPRGSSSPTDLRHSGC